MPELIDVVVETPRGSRNKYEHYPQQGVMRLDRRLPGSFAFPADYGYVPNTVGSDGEPLDALVLTVEATYPGIRVAARPIGVFWISTGERREAKLVTSGGPAGNTRSSGGPPAIAGHQQVAAPLARTPSPRTRWARQHCGLYQPLVEGPSRPGLLRGLQQAAFARSKSFPLGGPQRLRRIGCGTDSPGHTAVPPVAVRPVTLHRDEGEVLLLDQPAGEHGPPPVELRRPVEASPNSTCQPSPIRFSTGSRSAGLRSGRARFWTSAASDDPAGTAVNGAARSRCAPDPRTPSAAERARAPTASTSPSATTHPASPRALGTKMRGLGRQPLPPAPAGWAARPARRAQRCRCGRADRRHDLVGAHDAYLSGAGQPCNRPASSCLPWSAPLRLSV